MGDPMSRGPDLNLPRALQMPLRDVLRGLTSFAEATEEVLEPAARLLPGPLRDGFGKALRRIEGEGHRLVSPSVGLGEIAEAAAYLQGREGTSATCARVLALAWEKLQGAEASTHTILSETLAATRLSAKRSTGDPVAVAAAIFCDLRRSHVAGHFPGFPVPASEAEQTQIDLKLFAFFVWLLAERGRDLDDEMQLLDMARALTLAFRDEVLGSVEAPSRVAEQLRKLADHL